MIVMIPWIKQDKTPVPWMMCQAGKTAFTVLQTRFSNPKLGNPEEGCGMAGWEGRSALIFRQFREKHRDGSS